jgi:hypothetical protein
LLIVFLFLLIFACGRKSVSDTAQAESVAEAPPETVSAVPTATPVPAAAISFSDPYFEDAVRTALSKPEGDITAADVEAMTVLNLANANWDAMNAENGGIKDLSDLKYFPNLTELHLDFNDFHDISPVSKLTNLTILSFNGVSLADISPLSSLTKLVQLSFSWGYNPDGGFPAVETLDFMKDMKNLEILEARKQGIKDISALAELPKLWSVFIEENQISDISPLANIKTIKEFLISGNPISDYSMLEPIHEVFPLLWQDFKPDVELK